MNWRQYLAWALLYDVHPWLTGREDEVVDTLRLYATYCFWVRGNKLSTINGKIAAIAHVHKRKLGLQIPTGHCWLKAVKAGILRIQGENDGNVAQLRLPLTWGILTEGRRYCAEHQLRQYKCRQLGELVWSGLALSYLLLMRQSELFADDKTKMAHQDFCVRRGDLTVQAGSCSGE